jgi:hypothetical protein
METDLVRRERSGILPNLEPRAYPGRHEGKIGVDDPNWVIELEVLFSGSI